MTDGEGSRRDRPTVSVADAPSWSRKVDVVVVGTGGSGLVAGVIAAEAGSKVLALEKGSQTGGTTRKSGGGVWVPNNHHMKRLGLEDSREGALRYLAKTARPDSYSSDAPNLGLTEWEYEMLGLFYDHGPEAFTSLEQMKALYTIALPDFPNYYCDIEEDVHKAGRSFGPCKPDGTPADGPEMIAQLSEALEARNGEILLDHHVTSVVQDGERVVGVIAQTPRGSEWIYASRAVIFASGGFTHNPTLRRSYLKGPIYGGCASSTNEGDFVAIAQSLGANMLNMGESWNVPIQLERALKNDPTLKGTFNIVGDRMLIVNRYGKRFMNEKTVYNEATLPMMEYDGIACEYPNLPAIVIWDKENYESFRGSPFDGGLMPARGADDSHLIKGDTLEELATAIGKRFLSLRESLADAKLAGDFLEQLKASMGRYNELAAVGRDEDFGRGNAHVERHMHKLCVNAATMGTESGTKAMAPEAAGWSIPVEPEAAGERNPTMSPISEKGPYFAGILVPGTLDTKGGPQTDRDGRVVDVSGATIEGLYAVGNCAASPSGQAYWGAGSTLGPMITYAWLAGKHAAAMEPADAPA